MKTETCKRRAEKTDVEDLEFVTAKFNLNLAFCSTFILTKNTNLYSLHVLLPYHSLLAWCFAYTDNVSVFIMSRTEVSKEIRRNDVVSGAKIKCEKFVVEFLAPLVEQIVNARY